MTFFDRDNSGKRGQEKVGLGRRGEELARMYLENKGYAFVERNFERIDGEIDLVMQDGNILVFVEVRTRFGDDAVTPEESYGYAKIARLIELAEIYQYIRNYYGSCRIDAVCVSIRQDGILERIDHYENIGFMP